MYLWCTGLATIQEKYLRRIQRGIQGCTGTPLWAVPSTKKYTDVRLNGTPLSGYRTRKLLLWLTLECFRRNSFENRSIGLVGLVVCLKNERNGRGFARKWAWPIKLARASRAKVYQNPPSRNPGSATAPASVTTTTSLPSFKRQLITHFIKS